MGASSRSVLFDSVNLPIKGALARLFGKPFRLSLGSRVLTFSNVNDFDYALTGRVAVSLVKVVELLHRPPAALRRETVALRLVEHNLVRIIERCRSQPGRIGILLADIGLKCFTTDYRWRAIFESLAAGAHELDGYRHVAVAKYLQYLSARRDALGIVYYHKTGTALEEEQVIDVPVGIADTADEATANSTRSERRMKALPHGQPVVVQMSPDFDLVVKLADQTVTLRWREELELVDIHGHAHRLSDRRQTIGRAQANDVTLVDDSNAMSRRHLAIEPLSEFRVRLTDLSARGTFLPAAVELDIESSAAAA